MTGTISTTIMIKEKIVNKAIVLTVCKKHLNIMQVKSSYYHVVLSEASISLDKMCTTWGCGTIFFKYI